MHRAALPRHLHPFAWWGYALALVAASSLTTNPLLLGGIILAACVVTLSSRGDSPWGNSFHLYVWLGVFMVVLRIAFRIVFGGGAGPTVLFTIPEIPLPSWVQGISLFGPVSLESILSGLYDGMQLAAIVICIGAANSLANPKKLLASLPGAFYELGTVIVVAVSALPQLGESLLRVLRARKLRRGPRTKTRRERLRFVETIVVPVLSDALERSLSLAASMDVRGFGRSDPPSPATRRWSVVAGLASIVLLAAWSFRFVARSPGLTLLGVPLLSTVLLLGGLTCAVVTIRLAGSTVHRTQYRPITWRAAETGILASGLLVLVIVATVAAGESSAVLKPTVVPLEWPTLTPLLAAALVFAALPAVLAPAPQRRRVAV